MEYNMSLQQVDAFKIYLIEKELSKKTIEKYIRDVKKLYAFLGDDKVLTKLKIMEFKEKLLYLYKESSVNSILIAANSFMKFIGLRNCCVKTVKVQQKIIGDENFELTKEEYKRLLNAARHKKNKRLYMLLQTLCNTGIRVSEHKYVSVESLREGKATIYHKGKVRVIFFSKKLCTLLLDYCNEENITTGSIFITKSGRVLDRSNIWAMMKSLCVDANVQSSKVFPHNLRHLFALTYYRLEKDLVRLADILGHSSIETTRIYTRTTGEEYEKQLSRLGLFESMYKKTT